MKRLRARISSGSNHSRLQNENHVCHEINEHTYPLVKCNVSQRSLSQLKLTQPLRGSSAPDVSSAKPTADEGSQLTRQTNTRPPTSIHPYILQHAPPTSPTTTTSIPHTKNGRPPPFRAPQRSPRPSRRPHHHRSPAEQPTLVPDLATQAAGCRRCCTGARPQACGSF